MDLEEGRELNVEIDVRVVILYEDARDRDRCVIPAARRRVEPCVRRVQLLPQPGATFGVRHYERRVKVDRETVPRMTGMTSSYRMRIDCKDRAVVSINEVACLHPPALRGRGDTHGWAARGHALREGRGTTPVRSSLELTKCRWGREAVTSALIPQSTEGLSCESRQ